MREQFSGSVITATIAAMGVGAAISVCIAPARAQAPEASAIASASALRTPWGEPNLQGIWTDETETPLQRPAKYANQEFFTARVQNWHTKILPALGFRRANLQRRSPGSAGVAVAV